MLGVLMSIGTFARRRHFLRQTVDLFGGRPDCCTTSIDSTVPLTSIKTEADLLVTFPIIGIRVVNIWAVGVRILYFINFLFCSHSHSHPPSRSGA